MTVAVLIALILAAPVAIRLGKRGFGLKLLFFTLVLVVLIGSGPVPRFMLRDLQAYPPFGNSTWGQKNAIVVLGGGTLKYGDTVLTMPFAVSRQFEGLRVYQECKRAQRECHLILSGGDPMKNGMTEADVMAREFKSAGVPEADLVIENKSKNTFQNAQFVSEILKNYDHTIMVTSGMHMKRALLYFDHFGVKAEPAPSDRAVAVLLIIPVSINYAMVDFALHEYLGIARLHIYNYLGLNTPSESRH